MGPSCSTLGSTQSVGGGRGLLHSGVASPRGHKTVVATAPVSEQDTYFCLVFYVTCLYGAITDKLVNPSPTMTHVCVPRAPHGLQSCPLAYISSPGRNDTFPLRVESNSGQLRVAERGVCSWERLSPTETTGSQRLSSPPWATGPLPDFNSN